MDIDLLLWFFTISAIPSLLYSFIIYLTSPIGSINPYRSIEYIIGGFWSVFILSTLLGLFPKWVTSGVDPFVDCFFIITPREELVKFVSFMIITLFAKKITDKKQHPVGIMFYFGMVGLGFAIFENVQYGIAFGEDVLYIRLITATLGHMFFGMFFGYWVGLSQIDCSNFSDRTVFNVLTNKYKTFKFLTYTIIGYLSAVIYHGLWNYNISVSTDSYMVIIILMLILGIVGSKFAVKDLNDKFRRSLK